MGEMLTFRIAKDDEKNVLWHFGYLFGYLLKMIVVIY